MAAEKKIDLITIRKKREELEKQLAGMIAEEKAISEVKIRELAIALMVEIKSLGYSGWVYEEEREGGLSLKITHKKIGSLVPRKGKQLVITDSAGNVTYHDSGAKACNALGLKHEGNSAIRVLKACGYKVEYITPIDHPDVPDVPVTTEE